MNVECLFLFEASLYFLIVVFSRFNTFYKNGNELIVFINTPVQYNFSTPVFPFYQSQAIKRTVYFRDFTCYFIYKIIKSSTTGHIDSSGLAPRKRPFLFLPTPTNQVTVTKLRRNSGNSLASSVNSEAKGDRVIFLVITVVL